VLGEIVAAHRQLGLGRTGLKEAAFGKKGIVQGAWRGVMLATAVLLAGLGSGCDKVTGGGWIASSADPLEEKATFGFSARCKDTKVDSAPLAVLYDGQLEYHDPAADIRIHGDVEPIPVAEATCKELSDSLDDLGQVSATFSGTYRTQPDGLEGDFTVQVTDNGEPSTLNGDMFCITLTPPAAHSNCGPVQAGNIQVQ
jgi:hypothetical protein